MVPHDYALAAAIFVLVAGAITCFAGYRLFRFVLAIWGFILGAAIGSSMAGVGSAVAMVVGGLVGGTLGALALVFAYFVGVALVGAGIVVLMTHAGWSLVGPSEPPAVVIIVAAVLGAVGAMMVQRHVIVVGTAFAGAWMMLVGAVGVAGYFPNTFPDAARAVAGDVWILYPLTPAPGAPWVLVVWVAGGLAGTAVQLAFSNEKKRK